MTTEQPKQKTKREKEEEEKWSANIYLPIFIRHSNPVHSSSDLTGWDLQTDIN